MAFDPRSDYPLGTMRPDLVTTPGGTPLDELTLERLRAGGWMPRTCVPPPRRCRARPRSPRPRAVPSWRGTCAARRSSPPSRPTRSSSSTRRCARTARPPTSSPPGPIGSSASTAPRRRPGSCAKRPRSTRRGGCSPVSAPRSERFRRREERELRREVLVAPDATLGLVAMDGPNDPEPGLEIRDGRVVSIDGRDEADWDVIDHFVARHGIDLDAAREAMALTDERDRAPARRRRRPTRVPRGPVQGSDPGQARTGRVPPGPGGDDVRAQEAPCAATPGEPGARHQPEGEPGPARGRRGRGGARAASPSWRRPSASPATRR